jgi:cytochrome c oxidase accessory protein FixG
MQACENQLNVIQQHNYRRTRKTIHLICFLIFVALPFFNIMRFDIPRQRFYFFGVELWISEFGIIFLSLMFLMFVIVASSIVFGRVYCGYACPQMIFSETSIQLEDVLKRKITKYFGKWSAAARNRLWRLSFYGIVGLASIFLAFAFTAYFVEPRDLLGRLLKLDLQTAGGITGAVVTLITFLDFTILRQQFCTTVCPYGYLQGILGDDNTLLVHYRDDQKQCIQCKKCVRVCHMGIDIRDGPFQIQCVHCGECIDACDQIMGRLKTPKAGLIHYAWGETGKLVEAETGWYRKLGIRDAKRVVIVAITLLYLGGLVTALGMRRAVLVQLSPERATLYRLDDAGAVYNQFRVKIANRSSKRAEISFTAEGLPGARILAEQNPVAVEPGATAERKFEVTAARFAGAQDVNYFRIVVKAAPIGEQETFEETFLMPPERKQ